MNFVSNESKFKIKKYKNIYLGGGGGGGGGGRGGRGGAKVIEFFLQRIQI